MRTFWLLTLAVLAAAQTPESSIVRGTVLERDAPAAEGQFAIRASNNLVHRYRFDGDTRVLFGTQRLLVAKLAAGDSVEVVTAQREEKVPYAVSVRIVAAAPPPPTLRTRDLRDLGMVQGVYGDEAVSGQIVRLEDGVMNLRLTSGTEKRIYLRRDTSFVRNGALVDAAELKLHMRVYAHYGRTFNGRLEALKIIWGGILRPE